MNTQGLLEIAQWLDAGGKHYKNVEGFNIKEGIVSVDDSGSCGTICCIAGAAVQFNAPDRFEEELAAGGDAYWPDVFEEGQRILGLNYDQAVDLFVPPESGERGIDWDDITPKQAAKVIRNLIETGEVNWKI